MAVLIRIADELATQIMELGIRFVAPDVDHGRPVTSVHQHGE